MGRKKLLASDCTLTQLMQPFMVRDTAREYVHIIAYKVQTNAILLQNFHHLNWKDLGGKFTYLAALEARLAIATFKISGIP